MCPMFGDIKYEMTWRAFLGHPMAQPKWQRPKRLREDPETVSAHFRLHSIDCGGRKEVVMSEGVKWLTMLRRWET